MSNTKRINIQISERVNAQLDELSEAYGVSKSGIAALAIGQYIEAQMRQREMVYGHQGLMEQMKEVLVAELAKQSDQERKGEAGPL